MKLLLVEVMFVEQFEQALSMAEMRREIGYADMRVTILTPLTDRESTTLVILAQLRSRASSETDTQWPQQ